jgi:hypothetical protein
MKLGHIFQKFPNKNIGKLKKMLDCIINHGYFSLD